eukprot:Gb_12460 [translate_table: standard]
MSKRKFGFEGFGINKQATYKFEAAQAPRRLYVPPSARGDNYEDDELDRIEYDEGVEGRANEAPVGSEEVDPLDAFMEGIHEEMKSAPANAKPKMQKFEDDEDDPMDTFLKSRRDVGLSLAAEALQAGYDSDEEVYAAAKAVDAGQVEYDSDDNPIITVDKKKIEPIPALDHSQIDYEPFNKDFYEENPSISAMSEQEVDSYRQSVGIKVSGFDVSRPIKKFEECGFDSTLMNAIAKQGYENPTPIQCQALPIALSGRDIIGIAKTGSGKTAAFVLPMIVHIMDQPELNKEEGPIGVICAPTRELAQQIYLETKKFAKAYGVRVSGVYGGMSKLEQFKELKAGCEVVVATPGRLIDMLKMKALTMLRATYLVLDEADRMFDLGFEPQIRSIVGQIRPDRQTLLFSATMPRKVERLAREILSDPVRVTVGEIGMANEDITQIVNVIPSDAEKMPWLLNKLPEMVDNGDVLVFASTKAKVDDIEAQLIQNGFKVAALHGDKDQASRMEVLQKFKSGIYHVLVATDVAARGLDIKSIKSVVNFDIAKDMDMHVHRIGRTGRAGDKEGTAYTLITQKEARFAGELLNSLIAAGQNVPMELMDLAMKDSRFRSKREARKGSGMSLISEVDVTRKRTSVTIFKGTMVTTSVKSVHLICCYNWSAPSGFVSSGSVGGEATRGHDGGQNRGSLTGSFHPSIKSGGTMKGFVSSGSIGGYKSNEQGSGSRNQQADGSINDRERERTWEGDRERQQSRWDHDRLRDSQNEKLSQDPKANGNQSSESVKDRPRERRRPSGWDR